jgi:transposase-like protein
MPLDRLLLPSAEGCDITLPVGRCSSAVASPEEKIRIVLEGLRGEQSISELCRREGIAANLYYRWSKDFLEAGKKQLAGETVREVTNPHETRKSQLVYGSQEEHREEV